MKCGGSGHIDETIPFIHINLKKGKVRKADVLYPEELPWLPPLIGSIIDHNYKRGKRIIPINTIVCRTKDGSLLSGHTTVDSPGTIHLIMNPVFLGRLKRANPKTSLCISIRVLIEVIFHEIYHFKHHRGPEQVTEKDIRSIYSLFLDILENGDW